MLLDVLSHNLPETPAYTSFFLTDRNPLGGTTKKRKLYRPNAGMRVLHRRLLTYLRPFVKQYPHVTGALPTCSPLKNVRPHRKHRYFYVLDLRHAYRQVRSLQLVEILCRHDPRLVGEEKTLRAFLERYCFVPEGGLATGAPASPDLFNLYAGALIDVPLAPLCARYGLRYTRYLDDLTFSSKERVIGRHRRRALRAVVERAGFSVHDRKAGVYDLTKGPIVITGVGLAWGGRMFLPRSYVRTLRGMMHAKLHGRPIPAATIHGMMGVFRSVTDSWWFNHLEARVMGEYRRFQRFSWTT